MTIRTPLVLTVLCENTVSAPPSGLTGEHGWSIHVEADGWRLLFDTGQGLGVLPNSRILGTDLGSIDGIVLSHGHYDHTSGLPSVLRAAGPKPVHAHPDCFLRRFWQGPGGRREIGIRFSREEVEGLGAEFHLVTAFSEIFPGVFVTGEIPRTTGFEGPDPHMLLPGADGAPGEQDPLRDDLSLVVDTDRGLVVVLGCAHAGVINVLNHVGQRLPGRPFHMVVGGTHLGPAGPEQFAATVAALNRLGVERMGLAHCTGLQKGAELYNALRGRCFFASVGVKITV